MNDMIDPLVLEMMRELNELRDENIRHLETIERLTYIQTKANELDRYAIPAMQGILSGRIDFKTTMEVASKAYAQAESMIEERNKRTQ